MENQDIHEFFCDQSKKHTAKSDMKEKTCFPTDSCFYCTRGSEFDQFMEYKENNLFDCEHEDGTLSGKIHIDCYERLIDIPIEEIENYFASVALK